MASIFNLAVLEFEPPRPDILGKHGTYGDIASAIFRRSLKETGIKTPTLVLKKACMFNGESVPSVNDLDGVLILGSSKFFQV